MSFLKPQLQSRSFLAVWCVIAAFGSYACMYGFRKPFTAATFADPASELNLKALLVTSQVLGYTLSKLIGIKVVSEIEHRRRASAILALIAFSHLALLAFAFVPAPWSAACLFFNGLPLGMVYGLVLGFLEGRRMTELFVAGQCASFILADGLVKAVGASLLNAGVPEVWMPFTAGAVFLAPLVLFVWMLQQIPPPDEADVAARSERVPMTRTDRWQLVKRHGTGLAAILLAYVFITILRSVRADFAPEIWRDLGVEVTPTLFATSEFWVALAVMGSAAIFVVIKDNRRALMATYAVSLVGVALAAVSIAAMRSNWLDPFAFMVLLGFGMYVPYVAIHTTLFERIMALSRDRGNMGFLMYLADSAGYLAYAALTLSPALASESAGHAESFLTLALLLLAATAVALTSSAYSYARRFPRRQTAAHD